MSDGRTPEELVDRFLRHLSVERSASPHTVRAYSADLTRYLEWAQRSGLDPIRLTHRQMRIYLAELDQARYSRRTIARRPEQLPLRQGRSHWPTPRSHRDARALHSNPDDPWRHSPHR